MKIMVKKNLLKFLAFVIGPILPMVIAVYFLFPYINKDKYQEVVGQYEDRQQIGNSANVQLIGEDYAMLKERAKIFQGSMDQLKAEIDSINTVVQSLERKLLAKEERIKELENKSADEAKFASRSASPVTSTGNEEKSSTEDVKSLLGLEDENLAPIVDQMKDDQLVRLYRLGSSFQRKKLLRVLKSDRAAKLMMEVM